MHTPQDIASINVATLAELSRAVERVAPSDLELLLDALVRARRIAVHGLGREGLIMRALAMRLFHLGLDAHVVGEMTTPPVGDGDLLLVSAGPGHFATIAALCEAARSAGAKTACVTAVPDERVPSECDLVLVIPAQTMASDTASPNSMLPMGSVYEGAQFLLFEYLILFLRERLGISADAMRANHTNLE
ncbi:MAG: SIS domain-containing protein [Gammaproteobacteria bacterium]|nr:SIS domain-containing protein [Gammaproteobacteria bacterium]